MELTEKILSEIIGTIGEHIEPSRDKDIWQDVVVCKDCQLTASYNDYNPVNPCPNCGGKLMDQEGDSVYGSKYVGVWHGEEWIIRARKE